MEKAEKDILNPNPLSKFVVLLMLSFSITSTKTDSIFSLSMVVLFSLLYLFMGRYNDAWKNLFFYFLLIVIIYYAGMISLPGFLHMFVVLMVVMKMFYLPFMAGRFLIVTSDVGSVVSSMDKLHISKVVSIPIATMFRFGPSFKEEYKNIRFAMKMRDVSLKNPLRALEYIYVPLLSISSEIAEDIAKYAETKALSDPCKKIRLTEVRFGGIDFFFIGSILILLVVTFLCLK